MTSRLLALALASATCGLNVVAAERLPTMSDLMALDASSAERLALAGESLLRETLVRDAALSMGTQGGYAERAAEIKMILVRQGPQLDRVFNFAPLTHGGVIAPVVELVEDVLAVEGDGHAMRETARVLRVIESAHLVTVPPTWRDWLSIDPVAPKTPDAVAFPKSARERAIWKSAITESWTVGRRHADAVYQTQLAELTRAYQGMLRYHELLEQHIISPAEVDRSDLGIVREDAELRIGDVIYTVRSPAKFNEASHWEPVVVPHGSTSGAGSDQ